MWITSIESTSASVKQCCSSVNRKGGWGNCGFGAFVEGGQNFDGLLSNLKKWKKEGREKKEKRREASFIKSSFPQKEKIDDSARKGKIEIVYTV